MAYHTPLFLGIFLPVLLLIYQIAGKKYRSMVLIAAGYLFFYTFSKMLLLYLLGATILIYFVGIRIEAVQEEFQSKKRGMERDAAASYKKCCIKRKRRILLFGILLLLAVLLGVKYYNFFAQNLNSFLNLFSIPLLLEQKSILQPIGISFYTLMAIGYLVDIYEGKIGAERNFAKIALFMAFFPQIMEGPISRYDQTADQLYEGRALKAEQISMGAQRILWGLLKKMLVADRLNVMVNTVYANYQVYGGTVVALTAVAYTTQLYMEFSGVMDIVIGIAEMFGVKLPENFRQPFFSKNVSEFWRRWHITLGAWLKDYIFYPVSLSGKVKKMNNAVRHKSKYAARILVSAAALFPVWLCNGLWHGPRWSYVFYGMYYFTLILFGMMLEPAFTKARELLHIREENKLFIGFQVLRTLVLVVIGELFFRAEGLSNGIGMFLCIFRDFRAETLWDGTLLALGLDSKDLFLIVVTVIVVFVVSCLHEKGIHIRAQVMSFPLPLRWSAYYALMLTILIFGAYGDGYTPVDLIYAGF